MELHPGIVTVGITVLTVFLTFITALKYAIPNVFVRTRLIMSSFFIFIVITLSISFWRYTLPSLPFTIPAWVIGAIIGWSIGVKTEKQKINTKGVEYYMDHFAHVHLGDIRSLTWWSVINFYSIMGGLILINLVGLSTVIFHGRESLAIFTAVVGAFLLGTITPYIIHLWSIKAPRRK